MTSKLDYLKKYMDNGGSDKSEEKRKKKRKKVKPLSNIKIIDSQATFSTTKAGEEEDIGEFDLMEEKPILYAEDGTTILTKEYEEREKKKKANWKTLESTNSGQNKKGHGSSDSDYSPPRQTKETKRRQRHESGRSDFSPPRRRAPANDSDVSPPRKRRTRHDSSASSDLSPERPSQAQADSDLSPARPGKGSGSDFSPERSSTKDRQRKQRKEEVPEIVSVGKKAGLQSASELRKENELRKRQEDAKFKNLDQSVSGKGAETIYRDRKSGKKVDVKFEDLKKKKAEEDKAQEMEKYAVWGRGVAQEKENKQKLEDALHEISKPLARYKDDKDLDKLLKSQDREGDPMLAYVTKKKNQVDKNKPSKPKYNGPTPAPNRFNIWPGYRYDGVDRSNGFEKKRFAAINTKKTFNEAKHKWSVEDM